MTKDEIATLHSLKKQGAKKATIKKRLKNYPLGYNEDPIYKTIEAEVPGKGKQTFSSSPLEVREQDQPQISDSRINSIGGFGLIERPTNTAMPTVPSVKDQTDWGGMTDAMFDVEEGLDTEELANEVSGGEVLDEAAPAAAGAAGLTAAQGLGLGIMGVSQLYKMVEARRQREFAAKQKLQDDTQRNLRNIQSIFDKNFLAM